MSRYYTKLKCGCLVSCDGGGGLIPVCHSYDEPAPKICEVDDYIKKHKFINGLCILCHKAELEKKNTKKPY